MQHSDSFANASMRETRILLIEVMWQNPPGPTIFMSIHKMMTHAVLRAATFCLCFSKEKHETGYFPVNDYLSPVVVLAQPALCSSTRSQRVSSISLLWRTRPQSGQGAWPFSPLTPGWWNQFWLNSILVISDTLSMSLLCLT